MLSTDAGARPLFDNAGARPLFDDAGARPLAGLLVVALEQAVAAPYCSSPRTPQPPHRASAVTSRRYCRRWHVNGLTPRSRKTWYAWVIIRRALASAFSAISRSPATLLVTDASLVSSQTRSKRLSLRLSQLVRMVTGAWNMA